MWDDSRFLWQERGLIACILQKPFLLIDLDGKVDIMFFKSPVNKAILLACNNLFQRGYTSFDIDVLYSSLFNYDLPDLPKDKLYEYLVSLFKSNVSDVNKLEGKRSGSILPTRPRFPGRGSHSRVTGGSNR